MITHSLVFAALLVGAPHGFSDKRLTVELRQADATNVFKLIADFTETKIVVDECVNGRKIDILLRNAPASLVMDVIAAKINVSYEGTDPIRVRCNQGTVPPPSPAVREALRPLEQRELWEVRVEMDSRGVSAKSALGFVAMKLGLKGGVDFTGPDRTIDITLRRVTLRTLTEAIKDSASLETVTVEGDKLVVVAKETAL